MVPLDKNIFITESHNLGDDAGAPEEKLSKEGVGASIRALEKHGIFFEGSTMRPSSDKKQPESPRELSDMEGIEIIPGDGREEE